VIDPVDVSMDSPAGSPVADHEVMVAVDDESAAELVSVLIAVPDPADWLAWDPTVTVLVTFQVKVAAPEAPAESVAVMVTEQAQAVVGVPENAPVEVLNDSPAGMPVSDHEVMVAVDEESEADGVKPLMAVPDTFDFVPGLVTVTVLVTFQVKVVLPEAAEGSVALTVTEQAQAVVAVPVIVPLELSIDSPAGSPVADQVRVAPDCVSVAEFVSGVMADPLVLLRVTCGVTATTLVTFQVKVADPV